MRVRTSFAWYDLWVGAFYEQKNRTLYVCPLPTLLLEIRLGSEPPASDPRPDPRTHPEHWTE